MLPPQIRFLYLPPSTPLPPISCRAVYDGKVVQNFIFDGDDEAAYADDAVVGYPDSVMDTRAGGDGIVVTYAGALDTWSDRSELTVR